MNNIETHNLNGSGITRYWCEFSHSTLDDNLTYDGKQACIDASITGGT